MKKLIPAVSLMAAVSCAVNVYDHSTISTEPDPSYSSSEPDTTVIRRALAGTGGVVIVENCGTWSRCTLRGCLTETDGAALEMSPVLVRTVTDQGLESSLFQMVFMLRVQDYMFDPEQQDIFPESRPSETALPVVTGTGFLTLMVDRTSFPFLVEEAEFFETGMPAGGTISCNAVFPVADWQMRIICTGGEITAFSEDPEYRLIFGDNERRLLQQFYDIFVVHDGEPPVLPVEEGREDIPR